MEERKRPDAAVSTPASRASGPSNDGSAFLTEDERPLTGGRTTAGIVRVGDTVRRPATHNVAAVRDLLFHLERQGFEGVPRFLGTDERGRQVLTFLAGDVPTDLGHFDDAQLFAAARLLRGFHDATTDLAARWHPGAEVVCHNDWGPTNTVFRGGLPWGMIDFDTIAAGSRLRDLGYSAFLWLDLGNTDYTGEAQHHRLTVLANGYARPDCPPSAILAAAIARQRELAARGARENNAALTDWASAAASWTIRQMAERTREV